jgi:hypothetical protein
MMAARQVRSAANGDDLSARHPDSRRPEPDSDHHHDDAQARSQSQVGSSDSEARAAAQVGLGPIYMFITVGPMKKL